MKQFTLNTEWILKLWNQWSLDFVNVSKKLSTVNVSIYNGENSPKILNVY